MRNIIKNADYQKYYKELLPLIQEEKTKRYLFLILTFGSSIFFLLFAISPTLSTIANLKKQIQDSRFVDDKLTLKISALSSLSQGYEAISNDLSYLTNAVPKVPDATTLTAQIQSIADNSSIQISDIQISPIELTTVSPISTSSAFSFQIDANGDYQSTKTFINGLINMQRVISIDSLNVTGNSQDTQVLQLNVRGTAYYKP